MNELTRGEFFATGAAAGVAGAAGPAVVAQGGSAHLKMRWYGGGVYELAPVD
ncbi:MAG: hypothetical protein JOY59_03430, partial [Candidatus Eremiobacteraeota bacterium]|nr:hypothetical protein [Candidatus Eremiobacteraeota bacterium]